mmetsp:Transcript_17576/g.30783  ORF Transcript_17576/g.30783 Transcript_17576/m.30783 type:complete len:349 (-) Transcript_17576:119-1165(-)
MTLPEDSSTPSSGSGRKDRPPLGRNLREIATPMRDRGFHDVQASRDMIDYEVKELCRRWPAILEDNIIVRKAQGRYRINGREVNIGLVTREGTKEDDDCDSVQGSIRDDTSVVGGPGDALAVDSDDLIVRDGPLTQPFLDYVFDTGRSERYRLPDLREEKPHGMPLARALSTQTSSSLTFTDPGERLAAMSIAQTEASRETSRDWSVDQEQPLGEIPVMPPPPSAPWNPTGMRPHKAADHVRPTREAAVDTAEVLISLAGIAANTAARDSDSYGPRKGLVANEKQRLKIPFGGKRRHLYGEVILPGELSAPLFMPDEPIDAEENPWSPVRKLPPSKSPSSPLPLSDKP